MIIPTDYTPVQFAIPDDGECGTILSIWQNIYSINIDDYSYVSHVSLAREYNLIYALIKTDNLKYLKYPYTEVPLISSGNIEFYKLNYDLQLVLKEENNLLEIIYFDGTQEWYKNDRLHRYKDLPAIIYPDGSQVWYKNGKCHRDNNKPAVICKDGKQEWYKNGLRHRDNDLPAVIYHDGSQAWYKDGKLHRDNDSPSVINDEGTQVWYKDGLIHRDNDLPAIIYSNGRKLWYKHGVLYGNPY